MVGGIDGGVPVVLTMGGVLTWLKGGLDMGVVTVEGVVATVLGFRAGV